MAELDEVVQEETKEEISPKAEETTPAADAVVTEELEESSEKPHPLEPGGDRFKQVVAARHKERERADRIAADLQAEREARIRLEERLAAQEKRKQEQEEPELTPAQLEVLMNEGKATLGQILEHERKVVTKKLEKSFDQKLASIKQTASTEDVIARDVERYKNSIPDIMTTGSESRQKYEREYLFLKKFGHADGYKTQLLAARAAFGDVETVERTAQARKSAPKDTYVETNSNSNKPTIKKDDPLKGLTEVQRKHYERMIERGHYKDWKDVEEEIKFSNPFPRRS